MRFLLRNRLQRLPPDHPLKTTEKDEYSSCIYDTKVFKNSSLYHKDEAKILFPDTDTSLPKVQIPVKGLADTARLILR